MDTARRLKEVRQVTKDVIIAVALDCKYDDEQELHSQTGIYLGRRPSKQCEANRECRWTSISRSLMTASSRRTN